MANLPSVLSNVLLGAVVFSAFAEPNWQTAWLGCGVGMLLYLGGCLLNDWWDRDWDCENKPERAVPNGRLSPQVLLALATGFLLGGLLGSLFLGWLAVGAAICIIFLILVYSFVHKKSPLGVIPMGLCRSGLYFLGFASADPDSGLFPETRYLDYYSVDEYLGIYALLVLPAFGLFAYIMGLSLLARFEARGDLPHTNKVLAYLFLFFPVLCHLYWVSKHAPVAAICFSLPFLIVVYLATKVIVRSIGKGVSLLLAAIPLLDLVLIFPLVVFILNEGVSYRLLAGSLEPREALEFLVIPFFPLVAFVFARLLQKIAPAT